MSGELPCTKEYFTFSTLAGITAMLSINILLVWFEAPQPYPSYIAYLAGIVTGSTFLYLDDKIFKAFSART